MARITVLTALVLFLAVLVQGDVAGPWVTGNQDASTYSIDGRTLEGIVNAITNAGMTDREKAIQIWKYQLTKVFHTPQIYEPNTRNNGNVGVADAVKFLHSYGSAICGQSSDILGALWEAAGFQARERNIGGHTVPEVYYGGAWHYIDADMAGYIEDSSNTIVSVDYLMGLADTPRVAMKDNAVPTADPHYMLDPFERLWSTVWNGHKYQRHVAVHSMNFTLRPGEEFTRYFDRQWAPDYQFWGKDEGPYRTWGKTYVKATALPPTQSTADDGWGMYANGEYIYTPDLTDPSFAEGVHSSTNMSSQGGSPHLVASGTGEVVFYQRTPYVICALPVDGVDGTKDGATRGAVISGTAAGTVTLQASRDMGVTWQAYGTVSGNFSKDITDLVKGKYQYLVKFVCTDGSGLDALTLNTRVQVSAVQLPGLELGANNMTYAATDLSVLEFTPEIWNSQSDYEALRVSDVNIQWTDQDIRHLRLISRHNPAEVVYRLQCPGPIQKLDAGVWITHPNPPGNPVYTIQYSKDGGATWATFATKAPFSEGWGTWMSGKTSISGNPTELLVKCTIDTGDNPGWEGLFGFKHFRFYAHYANASNSDLVITHGWEESGVPKTHIENIPAGTASQNYTINVGAPLHIGDKDNAPGNTFVRMSVPTGGSGEDEDGDGLPDAWEIQHFTNKDTYDDDDDPDGDGLDNLEEYNAGSDPMNSDSDGDGLEDGDEAAYGADLLNPDSDGDGLADGEEVNTWGSAPDDNDSDNDSIPDGWEADNGLNPTNSGDASADDDGDLLTNLEEYQAGTDPNNADSDGDGLLDGEDPQPLTPLGDEDEGTKGGCAPGGAGLAWTLHCLILVFGLKRSRKGHGSHG